MSSISNTMRDTAKNAMDAGQEAGQAASAGARNMQADLVSLRNEVARLTHQIADIVSCTLLTVPAERQTILETVVLEARLKKLIHFLMAEIRRQREHDCL